MTRIDLSQVNKILIIMMGGIGNMIFLTPALKSLREKFPSAELVFLLGPYGAEKVIEGSSLFDRKIIIDPTEQKGICRRIKLIQTLRKEHFNLSFTSTGTNPLKSGLLCFLSGIKFRLGEDVRQKGFFYNLKIPFNKDIHEVDSNIHLIQQLGIEIFDNSLFIQMTEEDKVYAAQFFTLNKLDRHKAVGFHPGSGIHQASFKRWPKERFAQLADWIIDEFGYSIILFGGNEETELADNIASLMVSQPLIMTGKTILSQTAALIKRCALFISNDSGLLHVASAVNTPSIGLFGPTDHKKTGAYSNSSQLIRKDLACSPCYVGKPVQCRHLDCLYSLSVDEVKHIVKIQLKKS